MLIISKLAIYFTYSLLHLKVTPTYLSTRTVKCLAKWKPPKPEQQKHDNKHPGQG